MEGDTLKEVNELDGLEISNLEHLGFHDLEDLVGSDDSNLEDYCLEHLGFHDLEDLVGSGD